MKFDYDTYLWSMLTFTNSHTYLIITDLVAVKILDIFFSGYNYCTFEESYPEIGPMDKEREMEEEAEEGLYKNVNIVSSWYESIFQR